MQPNNNAGLDYNRASPHSSLNNPPLSLRFDYGQTTSGKPLPLKKIKLRTTIAHALTKATLYKANDNASQPLISISSFTS